MFIVIGPFICLTPDLTLLFVKKIFYMSPADQLLLQMKEEKAQSKAGGSKSKAKKQRKLPVAEEMQKLKKSDKKRDVGQLQTDLGSDGPTQPVKPKA